MSEILEILFGSRAKTRLIRFFLLNGETEFSFTEILRKNMLVAPSARRELKELVKIKLISEKTRKNEKFYQLDSKFPLFVELKNLFAKSNANPQGRTLDKIKVVGDVKLVLVSGVFVNYPKSKADMILVVNSVNRNKLRAVMNALEAEIGREVSFVLMNNEEFKYRLDMLDRFILDFLAEPHDEVVNKIPGLKRVIAGLRRY